MPSDPAGERPLRLLVAERQGWIARTLGSALDAAGWVVVRAHTGDAAVELVSRVFPDIVLIYDDLEAPDAIDLCDWLRATPHVGLITPVIIVSPEPARTHRVAALRAGAWDYVVDPFDTDGLLIRLDTLARARREVERLESVSLVDAETGLYNRSGLARRAVEVAADSQRRHVPLSCVVFAPETHSGIRSAESGRIAAQVGVIVERSGRASDVIGRLDGLLVVIAPATDATGAQRLAERLRGVIRATPIDDNGGRRVVPIRAAYCAAADFARSTLTVPEMLERALDALGRARADEGAPGETVALRSAD